MNQIFTSTLGVRLGFVLDFVVAMIPFFYEGSSFFHIQHTDAKYGI